MEKIKDTLASVMQEWEARSKRATRDNPELILGKVLSKKEKPHARFNYLRKGILGISVDSSAWLYNFNLKKEDLLVKLREYSPLIKEIRLRLGEFK